MDEKKLKEYFSLFIRKGDILFSEMMAVEEKMERLVSDMDKLKENPIRTMVIVQSVKELTDTVEKLDKNIYMLRRMLNENGEMKKKFDELSIEC